MVVPSLLLVARGFTGEPVTHFRLLRILFWEYVRAIVEKRVKE